MREDDNDSVVEVQKDEWQVVQPPANDSENLSGKKRLRSADEQDPEQNIDSKRVKVDDAAPQESGWKLPNEAASPKAEAKVQVQPSSKLVGEVGGAINRGFITMRDGFILSLSHTNGDRNYQLLPSEKPFEAYIS